MKPLLFLDVDGPLNPYGALSAPAPPDGFHPHRMRPAGWSWPEPLTVLLDPDHGTRLRALQCRYELVWATTWEDEANAWIAPVLGLPPLPYVDFPAPAVPGPAGTFWKTRRLLAYADGRRFAWVDDDLTEADDLWARRHHPAPALLLQIDRSVGLRQADFDRLERWADAG
ncbi:HAD domain-containing protein [Streptomyces albidoflavus]|uniref:HAD domain-containing protein n=1 Tax=Streptomyces TaxID=1883 RepID=UPI000525C34D|nr:HAD domain-containing protein [Streptomyces albidoflavus]NVI32368.1 hypothetical protein [Streptomyces sp. CAI-17]